MQFLSTGVLIKDRSMSLKDAPSTDQYIFCCFKWLKFILNGKTSAIFSFNSYWLALYEKIVFQYFEYRWHSE